VVEQVPADLLIAVNNIYRHQVAVTSDKQMSFWGKDALPVPISLKGTRRKPVSKKRIPVYAVTAYVLDGQTGRNLPVKAPRRTIKGVSYMFEPLPVITIAAG
jgi:hypothetical protein